MVSDKVKELIYKHHGLILTDEDTGKDCCDFDTVQRVVDTTIQSLKDENARAMAVIDGLIGAIDAACFEDEGRFYSRFIEGAALPCIGEALATAKAFKGV